jgi:two-component system sensor histidine kinase BaeS
VRKSWKDNPWKHGEPWKRRHHWWKSRDHDHGFPHWPREWKSKRERLFFRMGGVFVLMVLLVLGGMAAFAFLLSRLFGGGGRMAAMVWCGGCCLSLALPLLAGAVALRVFQGVATPLADVMAAADAVAGGDLSVRVPEPEHGPDEFGRLVESFNRMTEELERADQQRRSLTADVAHELRTPLHIIRGNLEGILDDVYEPTLEHISATLDETRALARLVDDLRTLSLAEAGQLPLNWEPVDVTELLTDVGTSFSGQAEAAGIDLRVEIADDLSAMPITADVGRLDQVLSNLMANALRHTPAGGTVTLRAEPVLSTVEGPVLSTVEGPVLSTVEGPVLSTVEGPVLSTVEGPVLSTVEGPVQDGVRLIVSDTGEGIPPEDLRFIFDRFWRGDRSRSHAGGAGSGLGLAIARQLVHAHGGRIGVESQPGQGTTFTIELPAEIR